MPIFGQVWLWSLLAFLLGALLCWVLVVLPVRRRIDALESRLATIRADQKRGPVAEREHMVPPPPPSSSIVPGFGDVDSQDEIRSESLTRAYALPSALDGPYAQPPVEEAEERGALRLSPGVEPPVEPPPAREEATEYIGSQGIPLVAPRTPPDAPRRDWFDDEPPAETVAVTPPPHVPTQPGPDHHHLVDDQEEEVEERGTIFTQRTMPIPAELIRQVDEAGKAQHVAAEPQPDDHLVDDLEGEGGQPEPFVPPEPQPEPTMANGVVPTEVAEPQPVEAAAPDERIALVSHTGQRQPVEVAHGLTVQPERTPSALPKRIPSKPRHQYHPFGVETVSPAVTTGGERMRSLFEPVIPAEGDQNDVLPPPNRLRSPDSRPSAPGPFGPGSAMPLPGGASPSPEFTIKASVTALRYCTPESPQFGRTVAEVWFRSAADAERVGFRPVG